MTKTQEINNARKNEARELAKTGRPAIQIFHRPFWGDYHMIIQDANNIFGRSAIHIGGFKTEEEVTSFADELSPNNGRWTIKK